MNAVFATVGAVLDCVVHAGSDEKTKSDGKLVSSDEGATDLLGANLGHVQNDDGGLETDTDTSDETTSNDEAKTSGSSLKNHT